MSKINHHIFNTEEAKEYGIVEAILLYNFRYWLTHNQANKKNEHDGYYWTYNSYAALHKLFDYIPAGTIRKKIQTLEDRGVLVASQKWNKNAYDRTKWYTIPSEFASERGGESSEDRPTDTISQSIDSGGQWKDSGGQWKDSGGQPIPDVNTDINKITPPTPQRGDGFLPHEEIASENSTQRKPKKKTAKAQQSLAPHTIKYAHWPKEDSYYKCRWATVASDDIEAQIEIIVDRYKRLQPKDNKTRTRARSHLRKLLTSGKWRFHQLYLAVERYHALAQPEWAEGHTGVEYVNDGAWIEDEYVKGIGNFFGKERLFEIYAAKNYKADIEEEDWEYFRQWRTRRERKNNFAWHQNVMIHRFIPLYGYSHAQLGGDYDKRYENRRYEC